MKTIEKSCSAQIEIKKSKFIAHLCSFFEFKNLLETLKKEHIKAVHFVYAYRFLNELGQIVEDKSDDNEPKGTSGLPSLNTLRGSELVNVAVIVVRYFGGVKLGTGGLVRAYTQAVNEAISVAKLVEFELKKSSILSLEIKYFDKVRHFLLKNAFEFHPEFQDDKVRINLNLSQNQQKSLQFFLQNNAHLEFKDFVWLV
ncbi:IMPACT family protein [Campylobacter sp. MIT 97-5078]|uniref:IMPACT family protein n=1 Tax=Campylobacter sp. MIT 97-5078 TaxID=1548153 RepID=UPI0005145F61|nr:YigZ family protein [Campylobacter sp. MIT 97-5078]KGI56336.1 phosphoenolpyruvate carboxykinase [Campylobacter sp. MIT 97-5078]KGI57535.1 phosphoenolpyruvate carboxykinase [Campylobacter sp. MIT 97-5078]KGI57768.1 phosphoenolpyruvate carboxykinase [Campylobacter sp. MIT 97-5078]TQR26943.1 YigZ family protein [Campylobacter sp. MIT 97-5078]